MGASHLSQLAAAIDTTFDSTACDGELCTLDITHVEPACQRRFSIESVETSHAASKDVAATGVL